MNLKKIAYYLGIALCLASPLAFGVCAIVGLDNTIPLSLMITSNDMFTGSRNDRKYKEEGQNETVQSNNSRPVSL